MHRDHTIINQNQRNKLQREQVPRTPTQSWRRKHQMATRSWKQRLHPKVQLCRKILCPALVPVKNYLWVSCNIRLLFSCYTVVSAMLFYHMMTPYQYPRLFHVSTYYSRKYSCANHFFLRVKVIVHRFISVLTISFVSKLIRYGCTSIYIHIV